MIEVYNLYLDSDMREQLLNYDITNVEQNYDNLMFYITNSEKEILYNIILGLSIEILEKLGFSKEDSKLLFNTDQSYVEFTNKPKYYIKEVN